MEMTQADNCEPPDWANRFRPGCSGGQLRVVHAKLPHLIRAKAAPAPLPTGPGGRSERGEAGEGGGDCYESGRKLVPVCQKPTLLSNIHKRWEGSLNTINYLITRGGCVWGARVSPKH